MLPGKSNGSASKGGIVAQDVTKNFIQHFGLHGLLHKVFSALLQRGKNIFLVADGRHHHDALLGILAHNALDRFDAFQLWYGDVHQDDIRLRAVVLSDSRQAVAGFAGDFAAEKLHHLDDILSREDRVVHNEIADRLVIFPEQSGKLWHNLLLDPGPVQERFVEAGILSIFSFLSDLSSRSFLSGRSNFSWRDARSDARSPPKFATKCWPIVSSGTMRFA